VHAGAFGHARCGIGGERGQEGRRRVRALDHSPSVVGRYREEKIGLFEQ
jgi:hypothetical protein